MTKLTQKHALPALILLLLIASACPATQGVKRPAASTQSQKQVQPQTPHVFAVHPTLPPMDLDRDIAEDLLAGRVDNWQKLGAKARPLRLILGPAAQGAVGLAGPLESERVAIVPTDREAIRMVEGDLDALAVVSAEAVGPSVRALSVQGHHPIREPFAYPILVPGRTPGPVVRAFAVGDIMLSRNVHRAMARGADFAAAFAHVDARLASADLTVGNYEGTFWCRGPRLHGEDSFAASRKALDGLRRSGFDVLSLANNHAGDFGGVGLVETVRAIENAGIRVVGAGKDRAGALHPVIVERDGVRFGFLAFNAAGESLVAGARSPGTAALGMAPVADLTRSALDDLSARVRSLRSAVDVLIIYAHWGREYTSSRNADQRLVGRALVDAGADIVVGTHPHWVQGIELHRGGLIAYSLGNFVFDQLWSVETRESVALDLTFWGAQLKALDLVPAFIDDAHRARFLTWDKGLRTLQRVWGASGPPFSLGRKRPSARHNPPIRRTPGIRCGRDGEPR